MHCDSATQQNERNELWLGVSLTGDAVGCLMPKERYKFFANISPLRTWLLARVIGLLLSSVLSVRSSVTQAMCIVALGVGVGVETVPSVPRMALPIHFSCRMCRSARTHSEKNEPPKFPRPE